MHAFDTMTEHYKGIEITINWWYDECYREPWEECDCRGEVTKWLTRDKMPGERVLYSDRGSKRFYDFQGAIERAKRERWDTEPYGVGTAGERAARAVESDFRHLRAWCNNEWAYVGYSVIIPGYEYDDSCGGIEGTDSEIESFTKEAIDNAKAWLDNELSESFRAACSDTQTVVALHYSMNGGYAV